MEPEVPIALHLRRDDQRGVVEPVVARLVDDDLGGLEGPVEEIAGVADDPPYRVLGVVFREVGPEDGAALVEVDGRVEQVGWISERGVVWAWNSVGG